MKRVKIINRTTSRTVILDARMTENFIDRLLGLMFEGPSKDASPLVIDRCDAVHTFFMRFDLDLVSLNRDGVVLYIVKGMRPFRISPRFTDGYYVIELAAGRMREGDFAIGDVVEFEEF